eukprot:GHVS01076482.1.p1 GENE.GHVS01076482.1~~GHVS01076482.1.p1  ORF type:complete len:264 (+),score=47.00 GHVS01076482.1:74-865(+)
MLLIVEAMLTSIKPQESLIYKIQDSLGFPRVPDDYVYRTERYDLDSFSYVIPIEQQGNHAIAIKFSEVYFESAGSKVFSVKVGGHLVAYQLDVYSKVGRGVPHDEYVEVQRIGDRLLVNGVEASSPFWTSSPARLTVEFVKLVGRDNPKVNAIVVYKAALKDVPKLPPLDTTTRITRDSGTDEFHLHDDDEEVGLEARNLETVAAGEQDDVDIMGGDEAVEGVKHLALIVCVCGLLLVTCLYKLVFRKDDKSIRVMNGCDKKE